MLAVQILPRKGFSHLVSRTGITRINKMNQSTEKSSLYGHEPLVSTTWLRKNLRSPQIKVVDATWSLDPTYPKDFATKGHISSSVYFNIDEIADKSTKLPHMLPTKKEFEESVSKLGINNDDHVVVYDRSGVYVASARVWWTFRIYGHRNISLLEGGLQKWIEENGPVEMGEAVVATKGNFKAKEFHPEMVANLNQVKEWSEKKSCQILDARPARRYQGLDPEPRPNLRQGHIPNSCSLPHVNLLTKMKEDASYYTFGPKEDLLKKFKESGINPNEPVAVSCGSGVTASVLALGLELIGGKWTVYDGSFSEWGHESMDTPVLKSQ